MRNVFKVWLLVAIVLSACESEQRRSNTATGMLALHLAASPDVINTTTRVGEGSGDKVETTEEDELVPDIGDFTIALMDGKVVKASWDKFSEYPKYAVLPVGTYTLKAYYGNVDKEGFESPYYEGTQEVTIEDDETIEVDITCYLTNVKVAIECTDAFKKYFSDYSTTVQSRGGNPVVFAKDEMRAAYIKPGAVTVYANVKKQNSNQFVRLNVLDIDEAKSREFYRLKLDVDAGSAILKISFDNTTVDQPIEINVSDDVLNMQAPFFTGSGYESGVMQEVKEGSTISPLSMLITARNGIQKCVLTTTSASLINQGWPTSIDLAAPDANELEKVKALGLSMRGLSTNVDKMAMLDFTEIIPNLLSEDGEATFALTVTDKMGRVNAVDETIKINVLDNLFAVGNIANVDLGVDEVTIPITLDGDITRVKFQYLKDGVWTYINVADIVSDNIQHQVKLSLPFMTMENFQIRVICGARLALAAIGTNPPVFSLQASEADMWATKATIHIVGKNEGTTEYMKNQPVVIQCIKASELETGNWITPTQTKNGNMIEITGLPADPDKTNVYQLRATSGDTWATNVLDITTERAMQVPNAGFEDWYYTKVKEGGFFGMNVYHYYPYKSGEASPCWATNSDRAQAWTVLPVQVTSCPTVIYTYDSKRGKMAAEIHTAGSGGGYASTSNVIYPESAFAGNLFIGSYKWADKKETINRGRSFPSRPLKLSFWYKYIPYKTDAFKVYIEIRNSGEKIGSGTYIPEQYSTADAVYKNGVITLNYDEPMLKKATEISIELLSTTKTSFTADDLQKNGTIMLTDVGNWSTHFGSRLLIDEIELVY